MRENFDRREETPEFVCDLGKGEETRGIQEEKDFGEEIQENLEEKRFL